MRVRAWHWLLVLPASALAHAMVIGAMSLAPEGAADGGPAQHASISVAGTSLSELFETNAAEPVTPAMAEPVETDATTEAIDPVQSTVTEVHQNQQAAAVETDTALEAVSNTPTQATAEAMPEATQVPLETAALEPLVPTALEPIAATTLPDLAALPVPGARPERPVATRQQPRQSATQRPSRQQRATQQPQQQQASRLASRQSAPAAPRISRAQQRAIDNYPSVVARRVARFQRVYRSAAQRSGASGRASVRFTVRQNGSATSIRIASSSGSAALDKAAIETVQRAAPFPPIPRHAGRSSWRFTIPLTAR